MHQLITSSVRSCFEPGRIFAIRTSAIAFDLDGGYWNNMLFKYVTTSSRIPLDTTSREYCLIALLAHGDKHWGHVVRLSPHRCSYTGGIASYSATTHRTLLLGKSLETNRLNSNKDKIVLDAQ